MDILKILSANGIEVPEDKQEAVKQSVTAAHHTHELQSDYNKMYKILDKSFLICYNIIGRM